jgi:low temperature requirement protein LtrA
MSGREPDEQHRRVNPLELLFDLTFVVSFAQASDAGADLVAEGNVFPAAWGFAFTAVAICWLWINFSWFASGFDTDDWLFRLTTMVQMAGVIVLALGVAPVFESIAHGEPVDTGVLVAGYVVVRTAMVGQWLRVARQDRTHRRAALTYATSIVIAQVGWVAVAVARPANAAIVAAVAVLYLIEMGGPVLAKRAEGGTPWHPHHIAERHGLMFIVTLGEAILATIAAVSAAVESVGWSAEAVLLVAAGTGLTLALWWDYFIVPFGTFLSRSRSRTWSYGYGHILIFASVVAIGMGLHSAAYVVAGEATIGVPGTILAVAAPMLVFNLAYFGVYSLLVRAIDPFHVLLLSGTIAVLGAAVVAAYAGVSLGWCLVILAASPFVTVVGYETVGHRHITADIRAVWVSR